jgi:hypothetical protein
LALFVVRHKHEADPCPANGPYKGAMPLKHLSRSSARQHGVETQSEAIVEPEHTTYIVVPSDTKDCVVAFVNAHAMIGSVAGEPASPCVRVVASGGCGFGSSF